MKYQIITTFSELEQVCQAARQTDVVMLDTEFVRTRTFYPQLGLIQLYDGQQVSLVDPLALEDMTPFVQLLKDVSVVKVLHACGEDIEVFYNEFDCVPTPMVDSQIMAAFIGYGLSTGFAALVKEIVDIELDKSESRTDWLARPLTEKQLEYAAADVFYLLPIYEQLQAKVSAAGWWQAAQQESQLQCEKRTLQIDPDQAYLNIKGAWQLTPQELALLKPLATWRYQEAVKRNLALNFVIRENELLSIARAMPLSAKEMEMAGVDRHAIRRHSSKIIAMVKAAQLVDEEDYPEVIVPLMDYPGYKQLFKQLKDLVKVAAEKQGLATEFIASKKQLNQFLTWVWKKDRDPVELPDVMQGWRLDVIGNKLNEKLANN
ncbi:ribonuclease D [Vibrio nitrifigilis]|uniref:Ribonuclease D n=1 Tax=Vibrio nitrifigilis TaxID=2789781 RepID=A0ABS0GC08_9VIBR|nr:ribonuclease D [Vibrio nitrifigilis]MBF8999915.1 ribonuclease D [Vibrio nitrifigilis]